MLFVGLIQNADQRVINLVRDLVLKHIEGSNTLILITIPMSGMSGNFRGLLISLTRLYADDMENQQAALLARGKDSEGERTIGMCAFIDRVSSNLILLQVSSLNPIRSRPERLATASAGGTFFSARLIS